MCVHGGGRQDGCMCIVFLGIIHCMSRLAEEYFLHRLAPEPAPRAAAARAGRPDAGAGVHELRPRAAGEASVIKCPQGRRLQRRGGLCGALLPAARDSRADGVVGHVTSAAGGCGVCIGICRETPG
jgi:hypothetical protein